MVGARGQRPAVAQDSRGRSQSWLDINVAALQASPRLDFAATEQARHLDEQSLGACDRRGDLLSERPSRPESFDFPYRGTAYDRVSFMLGLGWHEMIG